MTSSKIAEPDEEQAVEPILESVTFLRLTQGHHETFEVAFRTLKLFDRVQWIFEREDGTRLQGVLEKNALTSGENGEYKINITAPIYAGYHHLSLELQHQNGAAVEFASTLMLIAPEQAFQPTSFASESTFWGISVSLPRIVSRRGWGVGDFTDLKNILQWASSEGAAVINVQPLLDRFVAEDDADSGEAGPLHPLYSSAIYIDPIFIDVEAVSDFRESNEIQRKCLAPIFQEQLDEFRRGESVDYAGVLASKLEILTECFQHFRENHLRARTQRGQNFRDFQNGEGHTLYLYSLFKALEHHFAQDSENESADAGWASWPETFQLSDTAAVQEFAAANFERIEFYEYLQWLADSQLRELGEFAYRRHLPVGLCLTATDSIAKHGCYGWIQNGLVSGGKRSIERPDWTLDALRNNDYLGFRQMITKLMRYSGAVSVDRVGYLSDLLRPRKVFEHENPALQELLGILALESHRQRCSIISHESSGQSADRDETETAEQSEQSHSGNWNFLPLVAFSRAKDEAGQFVAPSAVTRSAVVTFACGDGPNFAEFWLGRDLVFPDNDSADAKQKRDVLIEQRVFDRISILRALDAQSLLPAGVTTDPASAPTISAGLVTAVYALMAKSLSKLVWFQLDELFESDLTTKTADLEINKESLPRLPVFVEDLAADAGVAAVIQALVEIRGPYQQVLPERELVDLDKKQKTKIPRATYRFQFNKEFRFQDATRLVPYLAKLGISHCYASPILKARPGSMHGYDIISHKEINPEIGTREEFDALTDALKANNMGVIVDLVPNHMGIGPDNSWWVDVLENGPASIYADYFDIDWAPVKQELHGKVLLPILGESYGQVLRGGQLKLDFLPEKGALVLCYYENRFPVNPVSYPKVLGRRLNVLRDRLGKDNLDVDEYQSIITAFERLPNHSDADAFVYRNREKLLQMRRLSELCKRNPEVTEFIRQNLKEFEPQSKDEAAEDRLHSLLELQAYRLSYWRVASDEINYRRFFDINELAAVRTEDQRVFAEMHDFLFDLVKDGKIEGLRIDHPDGLFDPAGYFIELQEQTAKRLGLDFEGKDVEGEFDQETLPSYIVVEKILAPFERLEENWIVHGTTGYDYLNSVFNLLVDSRTETHFEDIYNSFVGHPVDYESIKLKCKEIILDAVLASELNMLAHRLSRIAESSWYYRDFTLGSLRTALRQVVSNFPVYRTYVNESKADKSARQYIDWAIRLARKNTSGINAKIFDFLHDVLTLDILDATDDLQDSEAKRETFEQEVRTFVMKFQQFTGPVMAKSVEDTTFYRYNRFVCLNEVGGEPERFGITIPAFHYVNQQRQQKHPFEMLATSTHDTKRSEDVRARLAILSEIPDIWQQKVFSWSRINRSRKVRINEDYAPDLNDEYLIYQTLLGACPLELFAAKTDEEIQKILSPFKERVEAYILKAAREAKTYTSWINQNKEYENALSGFVEKILTPTSTNPFLIEFKEFTARLAELGLVNSLVQTLVKLTSPGVPDTYQGCELWDFSLVDPDNRRPVDYPLRAGMLESFGSLEYNPSIFPTATPSTATPSNATTSNATTSNAPTSNAPTSNAPTSNAPTSNDTTSNDTTSNAATSNATTSNATTSNAATSNAAISNAATSNVTTSATPTTSNALATSSAHSDERKALLVRLNEQFQSGAAKLFLTAALLNLRKSQPNLFTKGRYIPLSVSGERHENLIAFAREYEGEWLIVISPLIITDLLGLTETEHFNEGVVLDRLRDPKLWGDTTVTLPKELKKKSMRDVFSLNEVFASNQKIKCADLFTQFPVAALVSN